MENDIVELNDSEKALVAMVDSYAGVLHHTSEHHRQVVTIAEHFIGRPLDEAYLDELRQVKSLSDCRIVRGATTIDGLYGEHDLLKNDQIWILIDRIVDTCPSLLPLNAFDIRATCAQVASYNANVHGAQSLVRWMKQMSAYRSENSEATRYLANRLFEFEPYNGPARPETHEILLVSFEPGRARIRQSVSYPNDPDEENRVHTDWTAHV